MFMPARYTDVVGWQIFRVAFTAPPPNDPIRATGKSDAIVPPARIRSRRNHVVIDGSLWSLYRVGVSGETPWAKCKR
jgi:hypothetical protein